MAKTELYRGDCLKVMKQFPDGCIDLTVTSPPYDNLRTYNGNISQWSFDKFKQIASELYRITADGGVVVWIVADATINGSETGTSFRQALWLKECGFRLFDTMIWYKKSCGAIGAKNRYENAFEYMFVLSKGKPKSISLIKDKKNSRVGTMAGNMRRNRFGYVEKNNTYGKKVNEFGRRHNVWAVPPCVSSKDRNGHPAPFPMQLANDHIISWSNEGDTVLDCFMGSGTTGVACLNTNRNFIGIELDENYFEIAKSRIENAKGGE